tara:strand:+ start:159 stop:668 length:510 start_codon:yes stop_codon:yes gene_type:complete
MTGSPDTIMTRTRAVDRLDLKIMAALERNGRMTKAELSDVVGLSVTPCSTRIAKLEAAGFIKGYHADIDLERIGDLSQFTVVVSIQQWTPERAREFEELVAGIAQIIECDAVFGSVDFVMRVYATDADHCREVMEPLLSIGLDTIVFPVSRTVRALYDVSMTALVAKEI